jgi:acetyl-CoA C-acetyltransferase
MATLVARLRQQPGDLGLVTTVSGMLSKPGLAVWSSTPPEQGPLIADLGAEGTSATDLQPVANVDTPPGPGVVVSATVTYDAEHPLDPVRTAVIVDLADGSRTAAACEDPTTARQTLTEGLIGQTVHVNGASFTP